MSEFEIPIGSLEEQALKRKERLKNLKRKASESNKVCSLKYYYSITHRLLIHISPFLFCD